MKPACSTPTKAKIVRPWEISPKKKNPSPTTPMVSPVHLFFRNQTPTTTCTQDSGYLSDINTTPESSPDKPSNSNSSRKYLSQTAVDMMESWYALNVQHPYPSDEVVKYIAQKGGVTVTQVKKWMANKRVRCFNTLAFNGSIHPKRLQRLQKSRQHPYGRPTFSPLPAYSNVKIPHGYLQIPHGMPCLPPMIPVPVMSRIPTSAKLPVLKM